MYATSVRWEHVRESLDAAGHRVADLLRRVRDPKAPGTGDWSAAETAAHLSHSFAANLNAVRGAGGELPPHLSSPVTTVPTLGNVSDFNASNLGVDEERDLGTLAARIEQTAADFLAETADAAGDEPVTWLTGVKVPVSALACHWIGESLLHGFDIARGSDLPWTIERTWAALWFAGLTVPLIEVSDPTTFVRQDKADGLRACVEMRVRGVDPVVFVLENGTLRVVSPSSRKAACHVSVDAATNLLLSWGRITPLRAMATGRLFVWGRRPMQAMQLTGALTSP
jgi:hypothetical protein